MIGAEAVLAKLAIAVRQAVTTDEVLLALSAGLSGIGLRRAVIWQPGLKSSYAVNPALSLDNEWTTQCTGRRKLPDLDDGVLVQIETCATHRGGPLTGPSECRGLAIRSVGSLFLRTDDHILAVVEFDCSALSEVPPNATLDIWMHGASSLCSGRLELLFLRDLVRRAHGELADRARMIAFEAASSKIMHSLKHKTLALLKWLDAQRSVREITTNKAARSVIDRIFREVTTWSNEVGQAAFSVDAPFEIMPIVATIEEIVEGLRPFAQSRGCRLRLHKPRLQSDVLIDGRRGWMNEVVSCLVINAIDAQARHVDVLIGDPAKPEDMLDEPVGGCVVQIIFSDDGIGIDDEREEAMSNLGFTHKDRSQTGAGLAIARVLAADLGGAIKLTKRGKPANEDRTEFALVLPVAVEDEIS